MLDEFLKLRFQCNRCNSTDHTRAARCMGCGRDPVKSKQQHDLKDLKDLKEPGPPLRAPSQGRPSWPATSCPTSCEMSDS
jgi:hypothetical protein